MEKLSNIMLNLTEFDPKMGVFKTNEKIDVIIQRLGFYEYRINHLCEEIESMIENYNEGLDDKHLELGLKKLSYKQIEYLNKLKILIKNIIRNNITDEIVNRRLTLYDKNLNKFISTAADDKIVNKLGLYEEIIPDIITMLDLEHDKIEKEYHDNNKTQSDALCEEIALDYIKERAKDLILPSDGENECFEDRYSDLIYELKSENLEKRQNVVTNHIKEIAEIKCEKTKCKKLQKLNIVLK